MKRQHQDAQRVMPVQPRTLALARAEGKKFLEDFLVNDDPADECDKHHHRGNGRQPAAPGMWHLQLVMKSIKEVAATGFARLHFAAGLRIKQFAHEVVALPGLALRQPANRQARRAFVRQADEPARRPGSMVLQVILSPLHAGTGIKGAQRDLRLHPLGDLILEVGKRARQKNREQQPAKQQPDPRVQPGHCLTETVLHSSHRTPAYAAPSNAHGVSTPTQACSAVRQAKHQSTATR
ncbi:hypothetical protein ALO94_201081 [Pseudomonas syringae pv. spinaceae]|uniref:Homogentisate 1,2-dioxygenase n=1 Tax=Pseudomonas syringae pv. spinaceae TaxID=264459 RepID=A0A0Q0APV9_PSESX|nr:hypothetical protein ALO94_201081 [Pseudomonas syringae pv. spinaceae]